MLAMTLSSLVTSYTGAGRHFHLVLVYQDQDPSREYAVSQLVRLARSYGHMIDVHSYGDSVAKSRAFALRKLADMGVGWVAMFDDDIVFHGNPVSAALDFIRTSPANTGVVGWSHLDFANDRGYNDFDLDVHTQQSYKDKYGHLPYCESPSPFHRYVHSFATDKLSTQAAWSLSALHSAGVLDMWASWPPGLRCYDHSGVRRLCSTGYTALMGSQDLGWSWNMYMKPDSVENYWTGDAVHPTKIVGGS
jgi:hypothetical protein